MKWPIPFKQQLGSGIRSFVVLDLSQNKSGSKCALLSVLSSRPRVKMANKRKKKKKTHNKAAAAAKPAAEAKAAAPKAEAKPAQNATAPAAAVSTSGVITSTFSDRKYDATQSVTDYTFQHVIEQNLLDKVAFFDGHSTDQVCVCVCENDHE
jgi:hypothetical protein